MDRHHVGRSFGTSVGRSLDRFPEGSYGGSGIPSHMLTVKWRWWSGGISPGEVCFRVFPGCNALAKLFMDFMDSISYLISGNIYHFFLVI